MSHGKPILGTIPLCMLHQVWTGPQKVLRPYARENVRLGTRNPGATFRTWSCELCPEREVSKPLQEHGKTVGFHLCFFLILLITHFLLLFLRYFYSKYYVIPFRIHKDSHIISPCRSLWESLVSKQWYLVHITASAQDCSAQGTTHLLMLGVVGASNFRI